ncbi:MAG TPA: pitrilysin family protein, partial [Kofleriaceae bacterium]
TKPPALGAPLPFAPPAVKQLALDNGVRLLVLENPRLPLVAISVVHGGAGSREDGDKPGIAALTAELLDDGGGQRTSATLKEALALAGARLEIHIATDQATMQLIAPSTQLATVLDLVGDMTIRAQFSSFGAVRAERLAEIEQRRQRPRTIAAQVFDRVVFGAHPYAVPADGDPKVVAALTTADVRAFWERAYRPELTTIVVAGNVRADAVRAAAQQALGAWRVASTPTRAAPALPSYSPKLALIDMPGARQSVVLIGRPGTAAGDPRQLATDVANSIVGGGTGARLDRELHEQRGLTLGASASAWRGRWAGSWALATTFATDKTLEGIRAALRIVEGAREITADEVARAKTNLLAAAQLSFETVVGTTRALERVTAQGLPADWFTTYAQRLAAISLADVRAAATWPDLSIVVVGDRAKLERELGGLGLPIVHYERDGTKR